MTIYAFKANGRENDVFNSLKNGEGRFGWSYIETGDLRTLKQRIIEEGRGSLSEEEQDCYQEFLLNLQPGDHVVYINVPEWGRCTTAKITGNYLWRFDDDDFNHRFPVDPESVREFDRNDVAVHPALSRLLKLPPRQWTINLQDEFNALLDSLSGNTPESPRTARDNLRYLANAITPLLSGITREIQHTHVNSDLEPLIADVLKNVPGIIDVKWQGGAGDHGADIIAKFSGGLPILGLELDQTLIVQVKSFKGEHWDTQAVEDIRRAFKHYPEARAGLIVSTADKSTPALDHAVEQLREESKKPVALLIGQEVAAFILRYGKNLLA